MQFSVILFFCLIFLISACQNIPKKSAKISPTVTWVPETIDTFSLHKKKPKTLTNKIVQDCDSSEITSQNSSDKKQGEKRNDHNSSDNELSNETSEEKTRIGEQTIASIIKKPTQLPLEQKQKPAIEMKEQALFSPDTLLEDSPSELINQIGDANFTRTEGRVNIWRYGLGVCITDFFLYPDPDDSGALIVKAWDMRSSMIGEEFNLGDCYKALDKLNKVTNKN